MRGVETNGRRKAWPWNLLKAWSGGPGCQRCYAHLSRHRQRMAGIFDLAMLANPAQAARYLAWQWSKRIKRDERIRRKWVALGERHPRLEAWALERLTQRGFVGTR